MIELTMGSGNAGWNWALAFQGLTALGAILAPFVALAIGKQQVEAAAALAREERRAALTSPNRQAWINDLRNDVANFMQSLRMFRQLAEFSPEQQATLVVSEKLQAATAAMILSYERTLLRLKPDDELGKTLTNAMLATMQNMNTIDHERDAQLVAAARSIIREEWKRVKAGT